MTNDNEPVEHAPGPWTVALADYGMHWHVGKEYVVAECPAGSPEWDANARLIAAAPDLLHALYMMQAAFAPETIDDPTFDQHGAASRDEGIHTLLSAIAKATRAAP